MKGNTKSVCGLAYSSWTTDLPGEGYALVGVTMLGLYAIIGYWLGNCIVKNKSLHLKTHLP
ncbi:hypothetical protein [Veillonella magna]|uniref:hypothetical protein n=1 Tax=Veillonella magna TaxID=464322 RepID=UPI0023F25B79|nr:hypothetical protein [Veillonella magna]